MIERKQRERAMADNLRRDTDRQALQACRKTQEDAARLLEGLSERGADELRTFLQSVVDRMEVAIAAFDARSG
jgi:hypothetical protein